MQHVILLVTILLLFYGGDMQGQTFMALDPGAFAPGFSGRVGSFMQELRAMEPVRNQLNYSNSVTMETTRNQLTQIV